MKKLLSLFTFIFSLFTVLCKAQSPSPRFGTAPTDDNTGRVLTYSYYTPADHGPRDTAKITPRAFETFIEPSDSITDTIVVNASLYHSHVCDKIEFQCVGADTLYLSKRVIFNKGFSGPNLNIHVAAKKAYHITFIFDGVAWRQVAYIAGN